MWKLSSPLCELWNVIDDNNDVDSIGTLQVSDLDQEPDFSETVEQMSEIEKAQSYVEFRPTQTFPFLKNLDLNSVYR